MSGDELRYYGGQHGMAANHADMRLTADKLDGHGTDLSGVAGRARGMVVDGDLLMSIPFSPGSFGRAEGALLSAATQLTTRVLRLEALAVLLRTKAELIELADSAVDVAESTFYAGAGTMAGLLAVPAAAGAVFVGGVWWVGGTAVRRGDAVIDALRGDISVAELIDRYYGAPGDQARDMRDGALHLLQTEGVELLREHPGIVDAVIGALPSFFNTVAGPLSPLVPDTYEGILEMVLGLGLEDSPLYLRESKADPPDRLSFYEPPELGALPRGLDGARMLWQSANGFHAVAQDDPSSSAIRIIEVIGADGVTRWVVQIPGTQQWELDSVDGSDGVTNLELMDDGDAAILQAVIDAMEAAGVPGGAEVLLQGHSQGGIVAAALTTVEEFTGTYDVQGVFTGGSPIGRFDVPPDIPVLALEHDQDVVPRTGREDNPDLPHILTIRRDVTETLEAQDRRGREAAAVTGGDYYANPVAPHSGELYQDTARLLDEAAERARQGSTDPADLAALDAIDFLAPFTSGSATTQDWGITRLPPEERIPA